MRHDDLVVPEGAGETLFIPPPDEYAVLVKSNSNLRSHGHEGAIPELAAVARKEALAAACDYGGTLGLQQSLPKPDAPLIASGHQPLFCHPGVAIKFCLLQQEAQRLAATSLVISVDSDSFTATSVFIPTERDGRLVAMETSLFDVKPGELFESTSSEPWPQFVERLKNILPHLASDRLADPCAKLRHFLDHLDGIFAPPDSVTGRMILLRRLWQGIPPDTGPLELPVSDLCGTESFRLYVITIINRLGEFAEIYNSELAAYRKERKLRYPANPFPDLAIGDDGFIETPFWLVTARGRMKLFARPDTEGATLRSEGGESFEQDAIRSGAIAIRPRAITLSIYLRLFLCDLFIHGVGGAKYDLITDAIIDRFYQVAPPAYSCVSATLAPAIPCHDPAEEIEALRKRLRDIDQRPETVVSLSDETTASLVVQKKELVVAIQTATAVEKKELGKKIGWVNKELSRAMAPLRDECQRQLARREKEQKEYAVASNRTAPYFFFDPEQIGTLLL